MPIPIILPKFGFTLETADIVQWLKQDGDRVRSGEPICEVTTDKVNMEVEAPEDGTLFSPLYEAGATVPVTEVIAYLLRPDEARPEQLPTSDRASFSAPLPQSVEGIVAALSPTARTGSDDIDATPVAQRVAEVTQVDLSRVRGSGPNNRIMRRDVESAVSSEDSKVRATPAARHLAMQTGVNLASIAGSGPRGRVQAADVQAVVQQPQPLTTSPHIERQNQEAEFGVSSVSDLLNDAPKIVKLEGMRKTIATRLQKSFQTAPHIFFDAQVDTSGIDGLRTKLKARGEKLSVTSLLVKACAWALLRHPWLNSTLDAEEISLWPTVNVGVAVALDAGLIVPVVHHAERLSMHEIQTQVDDLANRARANKLGLGDLADGTFTISNLGMFGVDRFTAIINPPQVGILAVGRTQRLFVPDENDQPVLRSFMNITLSADHRVVDGAQAGNFLQDLRLVLEDPALLAW